MGVSKQYAHFIRAKTHFIIRKEKKLVKDENLRPATVRGFGYEWTCPRNVRQAPRKDVRPDLQVGIRVEISFPTVCRIRTT